MQRYIKNLNKTNKFCIFSLPNLNKWGKGDQESVIFVDMTNGNNVSYQYWEGEDHQSPLKMKYEKHEIVNATNDADFYTKISRNF